MKSPERLKDFEDGSPAPEPPKEGTIWHDRGVKYVWHNGGWWQPLTLPLNEYYTHLSREYQRDVDATTSPRQ